MQLKDAGKKVISKIRTVVKSLSFISSFLLAAMILIVVINVMGRFLFHTPLFGTAELVELMMVVVCFFAIPYTSMNRGHVSITLLVDCLPRGIQKLLARISSLLCFGIFSIIAYQAAVNALYYSKNLDECTDTLEIPFAPFKALMAVCFGMLMLIELFRVFRPFPPAENETGRSK